MKSFLPKWPLALAMLTIGVRCVERINFQVPPAQLQTVVEGMISTEPGPYTIRVTKGLTLDEDTSRIVPIRNLRITLNSDDGVSEPMAELTPGNYISGGKIRGQIGRSYFIRLETTDGKIFESEPEKIESSGILENIRFEYEKRTSVKKFAETSSDVFNIFVDATGEMNNDSYFRWKSTGTYKVFTEPMFNLTFIPPYRPYKNPYPCSGYVVIEGPIGSGGVLKKIGECECCECWVNQFEQMPQVASSQLVNAGQFKNIKVAEVPINDATFYDKFLVEIEQFRISKTAYQFFKAIRDQKENASSIFQPPLAEITGNFKAINNDDILIGLFWATSSTKKSVFINKSDVPYPVVPIQYSTKPCYNEYRNATTTKPMNW